MESITIPHNELTCNTNTPSTHKLSRNKKRKRKHHLFKTQLESQAITNLSSYTLTGSEEDLLKKGLSFTPAFNTQTSDLASYTEQFLRNMHTKYYFKDTPRTTPLFHTNSNWQPPTPTNQQLIQLTNTIQNISHIAQFGGPTLLPGIKQEHHNAIHNLANNKDITIKKADKGGSVVIMNTADYIHTALTHLQQTDVYLEQSTDHTREIFDNLNAYILQIENTGHLKHLIAKYIQPKRPPRTPLFYFLPKIHKPNNPPRPIISGCDSPTDRLSNYISKIINPIAQAQPSYLKDTKHFIQIIDKSENLTHDTFLVTADVTSLYTNIPHEEGMSAVIKSLTEHKHILPPHTPRSGIIQNFLHFILKGNHFNFLDKHYLQIQGTAMGTKMAPAYANIFMAHIEHSITQQHLEHILLWKRYIDDIFFIWHGTHNSLDEFIHKANTHHPSIKFTFEYSQTEVNFLDTKIYIDKKRKLQTTIYRKPTDKNLILHFDSHHPLHIKRNIIYTQALRYKRIISNQHNLHMELNYLKEVFLARGYPLRLIKQQINKAKLIPRHQLLMNRNTKTNTNKTMYKIPFHPSLQPIKQQIKHTWESTLVDPALRKLWPTPPTFLDVTHKNLKDSLIRTKQHSPDIQHTHNSSPQPNISHE